MTEVTLFEASRRLRDAAKSNFRTLPGGSVSAYLNTLPKDVRFALATQYAGLEHVHETGGRIDEHGHPKLFADRIDSEELTASQPKELRATITKVAEEQLSHDLTVRMGTPTAAEQVANEPVSRRDYLEAAFEGVAQNGHE